MVALQAFRNAHPPQAGCAFESACALPSGVIRGFETTSKQGATGMAHRETRMRRIDFPGTMLYAICPMPMAQYGNRIMKETL
jgi:hypothetical protein